jgi:hypothetical protein
MTVGSSGVVPTQAAGAGERWWLLTRENLLKHMFLIDIVKGVYQLFSSGHGPPRGAEGFRPHRRKRDADPLLSLLI